MRVLVDALGADRPGGGRTATIDLLTALPAADRSIHYSVLLTRPEPALTDQPNVYPIVAGPRRPMLARLWIEWALPGLVKRERPDLIHHLKNLTTFRAPAPYVVTVLDLGIVTRGDLFPSIDRLYWRFVEPGHLRRARRVIAISEATKQELIDAYRLRADQVTVSYLGISDTFRPRSTQEIAPTLARYRLEPGYVLCVCSISRKKNLTTLVRAVERIRRAGEPVRLVLAGREYHKSPDSVFEAAAAALAEDGGLIRLGEVPASDLPAIYNGAAVFAFPSLHEGFGLAPLEAAASGVPVVAGVHGGLREALADSALPIGDLNDASELADLIRLALTDGDLRGELIAGGLAQARRFSWDAAAARHVALYRDLARSLGAGV